MPVHTWGYVYTHCPECGRLNRVLVTFPTKFGPFKTTTHECPKCETLMKVSDPHKYDADGNIIEGGNHLKCETTIVQSF